MRRPGRAVLRGAVGVALIAGVFAAVVPRIASYGSVAHRLSTVSAPWLAGLAAAALRSPRAAQRLGDVAGRLAGRVAQLLRRDPPAWDGEMLVQLRQEWLSDIRSRWPSLTAATLVNQLTAYLIFELSLVAVGISYRELPASEAFLAWAIGRLISSLPLTPGGIGVVELGMIGTLVGFGAPHTHVVAAVLLYRGFVILPTLAVGAFALLGFHRRPPAPSATPL